MGGGGLSNLDPSSRHFMGGAGDYIDPLNMGGRGGSKGPGGKNKGPEAPDFASIAEQQAEASRQANAEQTRQNRPDQAGPFGSSTWTQGADGRWSQTTSLAPELQTAADRLMGQLSGNAAIDPAAARDQAIQAAYSQAASRLDPQWQQRESALATQLANEGFSRGDEGYQNAMASAGRDRNDAYAQAMYNAQTGAGNAAYAQALAGNRQPYEQLQAISSLGRPASFVPAGQADVPQLLAAAMQQYGANLDQYNAQQANKNSKMNGGVSLGSAALLAGSDERLKTDIERLDAEALPGVPFARWRWKDTGDAGFGVIAQDLEKVRPDLVVEIGGIKHVRYGGIR